MRESTANRELQNDPEDQPEVASAWHVYRELTDQGHNPSVEEFVEMYPQFREELQEELEFAAAFEAPPDGVDYLYQSSWHMRAIPDSYQEPQWPKKGERVAFLEILGLMKSNSQYTRVCRVIDVGVPGNQRYPMVAKFCRQGSSEADHLKRIGRIHKIKEAPDRGLTAICMPVSSECTLREVLRRVKECGNRPAKADVVCDEVWARNGVYDGLRPDFSSQSYVGWSIAFMRVLSHEIARVAKAGMVHCDVKPSNIVVTMDGMPELVDYDLAVDIGEQPKGGTLAFMAPEQLQSFTDDNDESTVDVRTDIYGLGITIYLQLTGELPFDTPKGTTFSDALELRKVPPQRIRRLNRQVPKAFAATVMQCLSFDPDDRPQTTRDLVAQLDQLTASPAAEPRKPERRRVAAVVGASAMAVVALVFAIIYPPGTSSELPLLAISTPHDETESIIRPVMTQEQKDAKILELLNAGYDAYERKEFEFAETQFSAALKLDPRHAGAHIGHARALYQFGDCKDAALELFESIPQDDSAIAAAVEAFYYAVNGENRLAIPIFRTAINKGLETPETLTNYAWCLKQLSETPEAIEVLERVRLMDTDTTAANLILAQTYLKFWRGRHNRKVNGIRPYEFDMEKVAAMIDECPEGPARAMTASTSYKGFAGRFAPAPPTNKIGFARQDPKLHAYWLQRSYDEFMRGVELGLDPNYWHGISYQMPETFSPPDGVGERSEAVGLLQHRKFFVLDPLIGSRLDRCVARTLSES